MNVWDHFVFAAFERVLEASLGAAILILILMAARRAGGRWLTPRWRLWCGGLVLLRLLWPVSIESPSSLLNLTRFITLTAAGPGTFVSQRVGADGPTADAELSSGPVESSGPAPVAPATSVAPLLSLEPLRSDESTAVPPSTVADHIITDVATVSTFEELESGDGTKRAPTPVQERPANDKGRLTRSGFPLTGRAALTFAVAVWLSGALWLFGGSMLGQARFARRVRRHGRPVPEAVRESLARCRPLVRVRRPVGVVELDGIGSPVVFGFLLPRIVLPVESVRTLSPSALRHVFLHELAHVRCADVLVNWLVIAARAVHWFNPLARLALRQFVADRELVRDQMALDALDEGPDGRRAYGHTLLELAESLSRPRLSPGLSPLIHSEKEIHRRITMITSPTPTPVRWPLHFSLAAALLGVSALTFTAATGQDKPVPEPVPPPPTIEAPKPVAPRSDDALPRLPEIPQQPNPAGVPRALPAPGAPPPGINPATQLPPATPGFSPTPFRRERPEGMPGEQRDHLLKELQSRLDQLDAELAEVRERAEKSAEAGRKRPELQQDESALNNVREELAAQYYRHKFGLGSIDAVPGRQISPRVIGGGIASAPAKAGVPPSAPSSGGVTSTASYPADRARGVRTEDDSLRQEVRDLRDQVGKLARVVEDMQRVIESFQHQPAASASTLEDARKRREAEAAEMKKLDGEEADLQAKLIDLETAATEAEGDPKKRAAFQREMAEVRKALLRFQVERNARERVRR